MPRSYTYLKSFHLNNAGVEQVATSSKVGIAVRDIAQKAAGHARSITPAEVGHVYLQSFRVRLHIRRDWPHGSPHRSARLCADLANVAPYAIVIERGQSAGRFEKRRTQQFRILGKTLEHLAVAGKTKRRRTP